VDGFFEQGRGIRLESAAVRRCLTGKFRLKGVMSSVIVMTAPVFADPMRWTLARPRDPAKCYKISPPIGLSHRPASSSFRGATVKKRSSISESRLPKVLSFIYWFSSCGSQRCWAILFAYGDFKALARRVLA
jgi:hypothetical protein